MNEYPSGGTARRQEAILALVRSGPVRSQGELRRLLRKRGIGVAQPTLSRDLHELGLAKTPRGYVAPADVPAQASVERGAARLDRALRGFALAVRSAAALVVVKTPPAGAQPVARALDEAGLPDVVGTIAGDDTVFVATPDERAARALARRLGGVLLSSASGAGA